MPGRVTGDPQHWLDRAAQMRALAITMKDPEVMILMTDLAADYEELADRGESGPRCGDNLQCNKRREPSDSLSFPLVGRRRVSADEANCHQISETTLTQATSPSNVGSREASGIPTDYAHRHPA